MRTVNISGGIGLGSLLTVTFVVLKLLGKIAWSWWWVLSPTLIPMGIGISLIAISVLLVFVAMVFKK